MFVRKKPNKSGSTSIQIIDKSSGVYKLVKTIGSSSDIEEIEHLYRKAYNEIPKLLNQINMVFPDENQQELISTIHSLDNDSIRVIGPELVFGHIFDQIGFNAIPDNLFRHLVITRITKPGSKLKLVDYLRETVGEEISVYSIYRFLDKLKNKYQNKIEQIAFEHTKKILDDKISIVFYDMTTLYFEASDEDDLRIAGFSKDGKHQNPQIYLGLLVGMKGYPIGYAIFEGNTYEGHTLIPVLEHFEKRFNLSKPIVVADAGLLSNENLVKLYEHNYQYILGARIKNESKEIKEQIINNKLSEGQLIEIQKFDSSRLIISYSSKRARKDEASRRRGLLRLEKNLRAGKLTKSHINNRGYNKYLKLKGEIDIAINYEKFEADKKWDGLKGYITNTKLKHEEIIDKYNNLWQIEKAFRISKTDLKIRPIYHRLRDRIEAHICISFAAYTVYKDLERILNDNGLPFSMDKAIESTNKMYQVTVPLKNGYHENIKFKMNAIQNKLIKILNIRFE